LSDGRNKQIAAREWLQRNENSAMRKLECDACRSLNGQAGFATATQAGQGKQLAFGIQETRCDVRELLCPTNKGNGILEGIISDHERFTQFPLVKLPTEQTRFVFLLDACHADFRASD